jgi:hypothetical protein
MVRCFEEKVRISSDGFAPRFLKEFVVAIAHFVIVF